MLFKVETRDALLHAIDEEYVEAVEVLLENEEMTHKEGDLHVCIITYILNVITGLFYPLEYYIFNVITIFFFVQLELGSNTS